MLTRAKAIEVICAQNYASEIIEEEFKRTNTTSFAFESDEIVAIEDELPDVQEEDESKKSYKGKIIKGRTRKNDEMTKLVKKSKLLPQGLAPIRETAHEDIESKADFVKSDEGSENDREFVEFMKDQSLPGHSSID